MPLQLKSHFFSMKVKFVFINFILLHITLSARYIISLFEPCLLVYIRNIVFVSLLGLTMLACLSCTGVAGRRPCGGPVL